MFAMCTSVPVRDKPPVNPGNEYRAQIQYNGFIRTEEIEMKGMTLLT